MQRLETRIEGGGTCRTPAAVGEIWLIPAKRHYVGRALGGTITYAELQISTDWIAELGGIHDAPRLIPHMKHRDPLLHGLVSRVAALYTKRDDLGIMLREALLKAACLHLLREYAAELSSSRREKLELGPVCRRRLEEYILAHLDQRLSLAELGGVAGLRAHQFISAFRNTFGSTPMQYVITQRLRLACALLTSTRQDIAAIAMATGFSSHSHLTNAFKQHYGITPRDCRLQAKSI